MTSLERVSSTLEFKKCDRVPVIAQIGAHSAILSGYKLIDYVKSGEIGAKSQINALKYYGYDAVFAIFDTCVEAEAVGSEIRYKEDIYPSVGKYALNENSDFDNLRVPNPSHDARMPEILKYTKILREEVGDETLVVGTVIGPMTIAAQLIGMETMLYLAIDHPDKFEKLLRYAKKTALIFALAQIEQGAHTIIVFDPSASQTVIPPQFYREFVLPVHKMLFSRLKNAGSAANWIHSAGNIDDIMPYYKEAGVTLANFDWEVDPETVKEKLPDICVDGNLRPLDFVDLTPKEIFETSRKLIRSFEKRGGFILSSGCEIPPEAKPENIKAMVDAVKKEKFDDA